LHGNLLHRVLCKPDRKCRKYVQNLIYALKQCVALIIPIVTEIRRSERYHVEISIPN
jgi:hypothetical protein